MKTLNVGARVAIGALGAGALAVGAVVAIGSPGQPGTAAASVRSKVVKLRITGGHVTDSRDNGRPVVLVAAALGVPTEVFRTAFSRVTPAGAGEEPDPAQVQRNKAALLEVLAPYGVTNERLDTVSNYYRYQGSTGELWTHEAATGQAVVRDGKVISVKLLSMGAGYSSAPKVTVPGTTGATVRAVAGYGTDLSTNGRVRTLKLVRK